MTFNEQKAEANKGHLSKVLNWSTTTSTGTMSLNLSQKHNIRDVTDNKIAKIVDYLKKYDGSTPVSDLSAHKINRDIALWFCRDLLPFTTVEKVGMVGCFSKVFPYVVLSSPATLSSTALNELFVAVHSQIKTFWQA